MPKNLPSPPWISLSNIGIVLACTATVLAAAQFQYRVVLGIGPQIRFFVVPIVVGLFFGLLIVTVRRTLVVNRLFARALAERNERIETLNRELEDRVVARTEELLQAQRLELVGQLVGGVAHDLNNLLTVIRGSVDVMKHGDADHPLLADIINATDRGQRLVNSLLNTSKRADKSAELPLDKLVDELVELLQRAFGSTYTIDVEHTSGAMPTVNAARLEQILLNLLVNARDAQPDGGRIFVRTVGSTAERVVIAVEDEGPGVPPEIADNIFERFFTTKSDQNGSGLGLSTVRLLVNEAGGSVSLASSPKGASFRVELPASSAID